MKTVAAIVVVGALCLAGCARNQPTAQEEARKDALGPAGKVASMLGSRQLAWTPEQIGRRAQRINRVAVLAVRGGHANEGDGVTMVIQVVGHGMDADGGSHEFPFCFEIRYAPNTPPAPHEVPCPAGEPMAFPPAPQPPALPTLDQLKAALAASGADEDAIRKALAGLDPRVRLQVTVSGDAAGVAVRSDNPEDFTFNCVMARVRAGQAVQAWSPSRVQLQPGELTCAAGEALAGYGQQPPH
jgi:hypothetical protein